MNTNLESIIPLLNKNLKIAQRSDYFNFSIDSLLISEFIKIQKNTKKNPKLLLLEKKITIPYENDIWNEI